jgi:hypothetical protein
MKKSNTAIQCILFTTDGTISPRALEALTAMKIQSSPLALGSIE